MADLIEAMSAPAFYPERPERVERRETHTAFVFLAGNHACQAAKNEVIRRLIERDR